MECAKFTDAFCKISNNMGRVFFTFQQIVYICPKHKIQILSDNELIFTGHIPFI